MQIVCGQRHGSIVAAAATAEAATSAAAVTALN